MTYQYLNYNHLYYFYTIATEGGVAKAASKLHLSQSALSTQLIQFEKHLGHPLFDRRQKRLYLNEMGKIALKYAQEIFGLGHELLDSLQDREHQGRIRVQIGAVDAIPKSTFIDVIDFAQKNMTSTVTLTESSPDHLLHSLKTHELDILLLNFQPQGFDDSELLQRCAASSPICVLANQKFETLQRGFPASLNGQPVILPTKSSRLFIDLRDYFSRHEIRAEIVSEIQDTGLQTFLAIRGDGLIFLPEYCIHNSLSEQLKLIGTLNDVREDLWLVTAKRKIPNPAATWIFSNYMTLENSRRI